MPIGSGSGVVTVGTLVAFLTVKQEFQHADYTRSVMQLNSVVMAMAGAERIFNLLDEQPETDEGYGYTGQCAGRCTGKSCGMSKNVPENGHGSTVDKANWQANRLCRSWKAMWNLRMWTLVIRMKRLYCMISRCLRTPGQKIAFVGSQPVQVRQLSPT